MQSIDRENVSEIGRVQPAPLSFHPNAPGQMGVQRFFWSVLGAAASVSISGNAAHAVLNNPVHPAVAVAVAVVPPVVLLSAVHGAALLARTAGSARAVHLMATGMTLLIAAAAFRLSFTALRSLAIVADVPTGEAWLWPVIIEGSMTQATVALLALAHSRSRAHGAAQPCARTDDRAVDICAVAVGPTPDQTDSAGATCAAGDRWTVLAEMLCAHDPNRRRDPLEVARILARHHEDGLGPSAIAREMDRSPSTISRIISTAARIEHQHPVPGRGEAVDSVLAGGTTRHAA